MSRKWKFNMNKAGHSSEVSNELVLPPLGHDVNYDLVGESEIALIVHGKSY